MGSASPGFEPSLADAQLGGLTLTLSLTRTLTLTLTLTPTLTLTLTLTLTPTLTLTRSCCRGCPHRSRTHRLRTLPPTTSASPEPDEPERPMTYNYNASDRARPIGPPSLIPFHYAMSHLNAHVYHVTLRRAPTRGQCKLKRELKFQ